MLQLGSPTRTAHEVVLASGHAISDDRGRIDMEMVLASLAQTYWAVDMPPSLLLRSWTNCLPFGIYAPDER